MSDEPYIHEIHPAEAGTPLLFLFHGTGGNEHQLLGLGRDLMPGASLVAPRGDISEFGAARFFRRTGEGVYDMDDLARATDKMTRFVKARVDALKPSAAVGLGYSNGANILASVLFAEPGLFDAVVLMHPLIPFKPQIAGSLSGKSILVTAGRRDPICPPGMTSQLESHLRAADGNVTLEWHEGGHELRQSEIAAAAMLLAPYRSLENPDRNSK